MEEDRGKRDTLAIGQLQAAGGPGSLGSVSSGAIPNANPSTASFGEDTIEDGPSAMYFLSLIPPPTRSGYLTKLGHVFKTWKRRFFVLTNQKLYYYESETSNKPKGVVVRICDAEPDIPQTNMRHYTIELPDIRELGGKATTPDGLCGKLYGKEIQRGASCLLRHLYNRGNPSKPFVLLADSEDDMHSWMKAFLSELYGEQHTIHRNPPDFTASDGNGSNNVITPQLLRREFVIPDIDDIVNEEEVKSQKKNKKRRDTESWKKFPLLSQRSTGGDVKDKEKDKDKKKKKSKRRTEVIETPESLTVARKRSLTDSSNTFDITTILKEEESEASNNDNLKASQTWEYPSNAPADSLTRCRSLSPSKSSPPLSVSPNEGTSKEFMVEAERRERSELLSKVRSRERKRKEVIKAKGRKGGGMSGSVWRDSTMEFNVAGNSVSTPSLNASTSSIDARKKGWTMRRDDSAADRKGGNARSNTILVSSTNGSANNSAAQSASSPSSSFDDGNRRRSQTVSLTFNSENGPKQQNKRSSPGKPTQYNDPSSRSGSNASQVDKKGAGNPSRKSDSKTGEAFFGNGSNITGITRTRSRSFDGRITVEGRGGNHEYETAGDNAENEKNEEYEEDEEEYEYELDDGVDEEEISRERPQPVTDLLEKLQAIMTKFQSYSDDMILRGEGDSLYRSLRSLVGDIKQVRAQYPDWMGEVVELYNELQREIPKKVDQVYELRKKEVEDRKVSSPIIKRKNEPASKKGSKLPTTKGSGDKESEGVVAICGACGDVLSGPTVEALQSYFHPKCFKCFLCSCTFLNGVFVNIEGKPYCDDCGRTVWMRQRRTQRLSTFIQRAVPTSTTGH